MPLFTRRTAADSLYRPIERAPRKFNPLKVPKSLQVGGRTARRWTRSPPVWLPAACLLATFGAAQPTWPRAPALPTCPPADCPHPRAPCVHRQAALPFKTKPKVEAARKRKSLEQKRAVVLEPEERRAVSLVAQLNAIRNQKAAARREQRARQKDAHAKKQEKEEAWRRAFNKCVRGAGRLAAGRMDRRRVLAACRALACSAQGPAHPPARPSAATHLPIHPPQQGGAQEAVCGAGQGGAARGQEAAARRRLSRLAARGGGGGGGGAALLPPACWPAACLHTVTCN